MSGLYDKIKSSKLTLKGESSKSSSSSHKKKKKKRSAEEKEAKKERKKAKMEETSDISENGGWWRVSKFNHLRGAMAIQFESSKLYIKAQDDGSFGLGVIHTNVGPDPEEILMAIGINEDKIALKSGYDKYLRVDSSTGSVRGISDAVGPMEQWEPIFQEGKLALLGPNGKFLTVNDDDEVICSSKKAESGEMLIIRSNNEREENKKPKKPNEEQGSVGQIELNYVKKYQKFQDHKIKLNNEDRSELINARDSGTLHEALLDRRSKMKADRYCK